MIRVWNFSDKVNSKALLLSKNILRMYLGSNLKTRISRLRESYGTLIKKVFSCLESLVRPVLDFFERDVFFNSCLKEVSISWYSWLRWWLHDPSLLEWHFNLSSPDRFHPTITWGNQISSRQGVAVFHLVFV